MILVDMMVSRGYIDSGGGSSGGGSIGDGGNSTVVVMRMALMI
jgi:hypothetical protein